MFLNPYRFSKPAPAADAADFKNVVLFIDGEGAVGPGNVIVDRSLHNHSINYGSLVSYINTDKRYGTTCIESPNGQSLYYGHPDIRQSFLMGTSDWTVELSIKKLTGWSGTFYLFYMGSAETTGRVQVHIGSDGCLYWDRYGVGASWKIDTFVHLPNVWYDFAITRSAAGISVYRNGVLVTTFSSDNGGSLAGVSMSSGTGGIFHGPGTSGNAVYAWRCAHVRVTRGVARTITPMTKPFDYGYDPTAYLMQFEGLVGNQTFYEEMKNRSVSYAVAAPQVVLTGDTTKYGRTAALLTSVGVTGWSLSDGRLAQFDVADFTLAINVAQGVSTINVAQSIASCWTDAPLMGWRVYYDTARQLFFNCALTDGTTVVSAPLRAIPTYLTWGLITISRKGKYIWVHWEGIPVAVATLPSATARLRDSTNPVRFGNEQGTTWALGGYMDNLRIKLGVGDYDVQWSTNPATPYGQDPASDLYWNEVMFMWGVNESITDVSVGAVAGGVTGALPVLQDYQRWGKGLVRLQPGNSESFNKGTPVTFNQDDFTIEFDYVEAAGQANGNNGLICGRNAYADAGWDVECSPGSVSLLFGGSYTAIGISVTVTAGVLYHITFMRRGQFLLAFQDETLMAVLNCGSVLNLNAAATLQIGKLGWMPAVQNSYLGNVRITRNHMRKKPVKSFLPPTKAFGRRYARWDNYDKGTNATLSNNDLTFNGSDAIRANVGLSKGKWYWEVSSNGSRYPIVGVGAADAKIGNNEGIYPGVDMSGWSYFGASAKKIFNSIQTAYGTLWNNTSDTIGVYLDMDTGTLGFTKAGVDMGVAFTGLVGLTLYPMVGGDTGTATSNAVVNFGQSAFKYSPPAGFNAGVYEENIDDVVTSQDLPESEYEVAFRLTGEGEFGALPYHETSRYVALNTVPTARYSTKQVLSGSTSLFISPTGSVHTYPSSAAFNMNAPRWTWRTWFYEENTDPNGAALISRRSSSSSFGFGGQGWALHTDRLRASVNGTWTDPYLAWPRPAINAWHYIEVSKENAVISVYVDGKLVACTGNGTTTLSDPGCALALGSALVESEWRLQGYLRDMEFWPGIALHSSSFTAPTQALGNSLAEDPYFDKVELLLHADGVSGSTANAVDSSSRNRQGIALAAGAQLSGVAKYGTTAFLFPGGTSGVVNVPDDPAWAFGTADFTLECWAFVTNAGNGSIYRTLIGQRVATSGAVQGWELSVTGNQLYYWQDAVGYGNVDITGYLQGWHHFAMCRYNNQLYFYFDGQLKGVVAGPANHPDYAGLLQLGAINQLGTITNNLSGYMDDVRITKGVARYTGASFVPPMSTQLAPKRKLLNITGAAGAGNDYQMLFKVGESAGSSGADFAIDTRMFPAVGILGLPGSLGDVSFTSADGLTTYPAWLEQVTGVSPGRTAWIWVKVGADLSTNKTIACQYGSGNLAPTPDGNKVFLLFDDFSGTTLDTSKWKYTDNVGTALPATTGVLANGEVTITGASSNFLRLDSANTFGDNIELVARVYPPNTTSSYTGYFGFSGVLLFQNDWETTGDSEVWRWTGVNNAFVRNGLDGRYSNTYYRMQMRRSAGAGSFLIDGAVKYNTAAGVLTAQATLQLTDAWDSGKSAKVDWAGVKKYQVIEPVFASAAAEEILGAGVRTNRSPDMSKYGNLKFWLDATDGSSLTLSGSNISGWTEKISGKVFAQSDPTLQPTLTAAGALMKNQCVDFGNNAKKWLMSAAAVRTRGICTIFIVGYWGNSPGAYGALAFGTGTDMTGASSIQNGSASPYTLQWYAPATNANGGIQFSAGAPGSYYNSTALTRGNTFLAEYQAEHLVNQSLLRLSGGSVPPTYPASTARFPEYFDWRFLGTADSLYGANGAYGEILVYEGYLDATTRNAIRKDLALKWNLK